MAKKVWAGSISLRKSVIIIAVIVAVPLAGAAPAGRTALIAMSLILPAILPRAAVDLWIWERQKQNKPVAAVAIQRWAKYGSWAYLLFIGLLAVVLKL